MTDNSNNIIYPSFFKKIYENKKNTFNLESLNMSNISLWKKSFSIDNSNNIITDHKQFSKLIINLKNCLTNKALLVSTSFSNKKVLLGNIYTYYIQFLSQTLFNNPLLIEPFTKNNKIKKSVFSFIDSLINSLYDKEYLDKFILNNFEIKNNQIQFKIDTIQFKIEIPSTSINLFNNISVIPKTFWIINVLISEHK
jgi:hypothetical protein